MEGPLAGRRAPHPSAGPRAAKGYTAHKTVHARDVFRLVAQDLCPYAQRCRVLLEEKRAPYVTEYIQLDQKPAWFAKLAPTGTVPLLVHGDVVVDGSLAINEYVDAHWGVPTGPRAPDEVEGLRARLTVLSEAMAIVWSACIATSDQARDAELRRLESSLGRITLSRPRPSDHGSLDLFECALVPLGLRLRWMAGVTTFPAFDVPAALDAWLDVALERPSATTSLLPHVRDKFEAWLRRRLPSGAQAPRVLAP